VKRLAAIELDGYFGDHKDLDSGVYELRWKNGRRLYYAYIPESRIILLLGGNKNGQEKDITQAKKILKKWNAQNET
jgi:putative addiction module killer protein